MRILGSIVDSLVLAMLETHAQSCPSRAVGSELVSDLHPWGAGLLAYEFAQELFRRAPIPAVLNQSVENEAIGVDGAPQPLLLAIDRDHNFVEMPLVADLPRPPTDLVGVDPSEFLRPALHGFVGNGDTARRQQVRDHT